MKSRLEIQTIIYDLEKAAEDIENLEGFTNFEHRMLDKAYDNVTSALMALEDLLATAD